LFHSYIDDLADQLNLVKTDDSISALLLADDVQTLGRDETDILFHCDVITAWTELNGMEINHAKCGVMGSDAIFAICGKPVPVVARYTYLGAPHAVSGVRFREHVERYVEKAEKCLKFVLRFRDQWTEAIKLVFYSF
jgi:hypothetical protein